MTTKSCLFEVWNNSVSSLWWSHESIQAIKRHRTGLPLWCSGLRIQQYHSRGSQVTAVAQVPSLAWELPHAMGAAKEKKKKRCRTIHTLYSNDDFLVLIFY